MKTAFIGTVKFSEDALRKLIDMGIDIDLVVTKRESGINSDHADLTDICRDKNIEYVCTATVNTSEVKGLLRKKAPEYIFCFGWSELLDEEILDIPEYGTIGFHPALLPKNRGRHPIVWALALGLEKTGSTFFMMDKGVDSGDILSQKEIVVDYHDDAATLYQKITDTALGQLEELLPELKEGTYKRIPQVQGAGNNWRKRGSEDGQIDWRMDSFTIYNLVRALSHPYVGAHFTWKGQDVKCWKVEEVTECQNSHIEHGKIMEVFEDGTFVVKAGNNCVRILEYYPSGLDIKKGDYLR